MEKDNQFFLYLKKLNVIVYYDIVFLYDEHNLASISNACYSDE